MRKRKHQEPCNRACLACREYELNALKYEEGILKENNPPRGERVADYAKRYDVSEGDLKSHQRCWKDLKPHRMDDQAFLNFRNSLDYMGSLHHVQAITLPKHQEYITH